MCFLFENRRRVTLSIFYHLSNYKILCGSRQVLKFWNNSLTPPEVLLYGVPAGTLSIRVWQGGDASRCPGRAEER